MTYKLTNAYFEDPEGIAGQEFGVYVTVRKRRECTSGDSIWLCQCKVCGSHRNVSLDRLKREMPSSCPYCHKQQTQESLQRKRVYQAWSNLESRCYNPKNPGYKNYGGRGIKVWEEWKNSFQSFFEYVKTLPRYGETGMSLDRIDNDKGYCPGNLRWATAKEQCNNRRARNGRKTVRQERV